MQKESRRGYSPDDERDFSELALMKLKDSAADYQYLLNRGYHEKNASTYIGNHYLLSERQRMFLVRAVASRQNISGRGAKEIAPGDVCPEMRPNIDGFNTIITLEVALSGSPVLRCMDGTLRDLAGLRGSYHIIDKTETAILLILGELRTLGIGGAVFYLDAPVSNSGRLKGLITGLAGETGMEADVRTINGVDRALEKLPAVITSDAVILDKCESWINLNGRIIGKIPQRRVIDIHDLPPQPSF